ncbi:TerD family protein [Bacillus sp. DX4.1]|uniref:TerD family protein n=1 Tax=Bacillus sp. DX4.1 TaxID=3055867 RepID=UPI0025A0F153|nr:TerD family protein [Bacillus sp. DX4.1]MDM5190596.1 TerD family protein [Bacillus sp. DX4.1]
MTLQLRKGQKVDLTKTNPTLTHIKIGLGWNLSPKSSSHAFDLDASALLLDENGRIADLEHIVYYNQRTALQGAITLSPDNRTGAGAGDDEEISISLQKLPSHIERIMLTITIHDAVARMQTFGQVNRSYVRIINAATDEELFHYNLEKEFSSETALIIGEIYRYKGDWKFGAVGRGLQGGLINLSQQFRALHTPSNFFQKLEPKINPLSMPKNINLSKIELKKSGDTINLQKTDKPLGEIAVNLNWSKQKEQKQKGFFTSLMAGGSSLVDLDLGCLFEFKDGWKDVVQPLGNIFGSFYDEPYIHLDQDDRTGASVNGENLRINGDMVHEIKRILIFSYIYEGIANWSQVDGVVTLKQQNGPDIIVKMDEHRNGFNTCAVAMLENVNDETFKVQRLVKYFKGHKEMDRHYKWGMNWVAGSK